MVAEVYSTSPDQELAPADEQTAESAGESIEQTPHVPVDIDLTTLSSNESADSEPGMLDEDSVAEPADSHADTSKTVSVESLEAARQTIGVLDLQSAPPGQFEFDVDMADLAIIGEDNDDEITEIFVEEAEEEITAISESLPAWMDNPEDKESLSTLRRSFHTLKGSGRLVGAKRIGEFAWSYENMLNRVIDGTLEPTPVIVDLLEKARQTLPVLAAQIKDGAPLTLPAHKLMAAANAVVEGQPVADYWLETPGALAAVDNEANDVALEPEPDERSQSVPGDQGSEETSASDLEFTGEALAPVSEKLEQLDGGAGTLEPVSTPECMETNDIRNLMDPVLYEIFKAESLVHLATIDRYLNSGEFRVTEELTRALHTLHGSANMASVTPMAEVAAALERYSRVLADTDVQLSDDGFDMLLVGQAMMRDILAKLPDRIDEPESLADFIARVYGAQQAAAEWRTPDAGIESGAGWENASIGELSEDTSRAILDEAGDEFPLGIQAEEEAAAEPVDTESVPADMVVDSGQDHYADIDEELLQIFVEESGEILARSDEALAHWSHDRGDLLSLEQLQRELHTLKGGARMADLAPVANLTHAMESLVNAIAADRVVSPDDAVQQCVMAHDVLTQQLELVRRRAPLIDAVDIIGRLDAVERRESRPAFEGEASEGEQVRPEVAAAVEVDGVDPELTRIFIEEANDVLEQSESALQAWKHAPEDKALVARLQRNLHTLKGGARMAGISAIGDLSHAMESFIVDLAESRSAVSGAVFSALEAALDRAVAMVGKLATAEPLEPAEDLCNKLEILRHEQPVPANEPMAVATESVQSARKEAGRVDEFPQLDRRTQPRESHELVRVRADLLDSLVNNAGEVSIYRARIEQQVGALRFNLMEMDQTIARLRDQLRKLEIETEAQILFRYEREIESGDADFDPLEMDRYSHLQQLSRSLMESVADLNSLQNLLENVTRESETLLLQQARVNTELQEGLMHTRMVPFLGLAPRMRRIVRQTCQELGKKAELELSGADGELDRTVIDRIIAPIEHMLRNAISHGIESPAERSASGKPETGTIRITFGRESSDVVLRIMDDGAGINLARVREKAIERGLMQPDAGLSDNQVLQFILETGFSTAKQISQVAGRGVGMDVVNSEVRQLGGSLHIESVQGAGTTFTIRLPFTLAINQSLLVEVSENTYAIPLSSIQGIVRVERDRLLKHYADPGLKLEYGGTDYEVRYLGELLGACKPNLNTSQSRVPMLLAKAGDYVMALQVDSLMGSREIVVKSVGPQISTVRGISGATILGDGRVVMILDVAALLRGGISPLSKVEEIFQRTPRKETVTVMVVDDSITVRKVTGRLLERHGMRVVTAKDGVDAVAKLNDIVPDVMLLDIEMPRMDGFELATHVRNEPGLKQIPIIMITSRTGDKHRQRAMEIGVERYLGKPFQESELLENINSLLGRPALHG